MTLDSDDWNIKGKNWAWSPRDGIWGRGNYGGTGRAKDGKYGYGQAFSISTLGHSRWRNPESNRLDRWGPLELQASLRASVETKRGNFCG